jgi:hypothetical protein
VHPESSEDWRAWLDANHATSTGVWVVSLKSHTGKSRIPSADEVTEALAYGWVDSKKVTVDVAKENGAWTLLDDVEDLVVPAGPGRGLPPPQLGPPLGVVPSVFEAGDPPVDRAGEEARDAGEADP